MGSLRVYIRFKDMTRGVGWLYLIRLSFFFLHISGVFHEINGFTARDRGNEM